jgi:hypothetical protein
LLRRERKKNFAVMGSFILDCLAIDDRTKASLSVQGWQKGFARRATRAALPQVSRAALLSALVKAYKPCHRKGRANLPGLLLDRHGARLGGQRF